MIPFQDRDNIEDWYFLESQKRKNVNNPETFSDGPHQQPTDNDTATARKRTKDFIENELHAMSTLSLYDDSLNKVKIPGEADK